MKLRIPIPGWNGSDELEIGQIQNFLNMVLQVICYFP